MLAFITHDQLDAIRKVDPNFNYDTALPQGLYEAIHRVTGQNPCGHIVYVYQKGLCAGYAQATSNAGANLLTEYLTAN